MTLSGRDHYENGPYQFVTATYRIGPTEQARSHKYNNYAEMHGEKHKG